jgi:hypothetical protein
MVRDSTIHGSDCAVNIFLRLRIMQNVHLDKLNLSTINVKDVFTYLKENISFGA